MKRQVPSGTKPAVLLEIGRWIAAHGVDAPGDEHRAARDLLLRRPPRLDVGSLGLAPCAAGASHEVARAPGAASESTA